MVNKYKIQPCISFWCKICSKTKKVSVKSRYEERRNYPLV